MANGDQLVLGFFPNEEAAKKAAAELEGMDRSVLGIKFDNIGILVKDNKGKVKAQMNGPRRTVLGVVLGAIVGVLTGGIGLILAGTIGGVLGHFVHKGLGLSKEDLNRIWVLRKVLSPLSPVEAMELLLDRMGKTRTNSEFLASMQKMS